MPQEIEYTKALNPHSVELKRSNKGEVSWTVKAYGDTPRESKVKAEQVHDELLEKYKKEEA